MKKKRIEEYIDKLTNDHSMVETDVRGSNEFSLCMTSDLGNSVESIVTVSIDKNGNEFLAIGLNFIPLENSYRLFEKEISYYEGWSSVEDNFNIMTFSGEIASFSKNGEVKNDFGLGVRRKNAEFGVFGFIDKEIDDLYLQWALLLSEFENMEDGFSDLDSMNKLLRIFEKRSNVMSLSRGFIWRKHEIDKDFEYSLHEKLGSFINEHQIDYPLGKYKLWLESGNFSH